MSDAFCIDPPDRPSRESNREGNRDWQGFQAHVRETHPKVIPAPSEHIQPFVSVVEQFSTALKSSGLKQISSLLADDVLILESGGAERSREEHLGGHAKHDDAFLKEAHIQIKQRTARCKWQHGLGRH